MRTSAAFLIAAVALGAAVWLHSGWKPDSYTAYGVVCPETHLEGLSPRPSTRPGSLVKEPRLVRCAYGARRAASWQDPLKVVLAVAGVGAGIAVAASGGGLARMARV